MALEGRGRHYTKIRERVEDALRLLYGQGWPGALAYRFGVQGRLRVHEHAVAARGVGARPLRVGFASDLHAGPTTDPRVHDEAAEALGAARLDVLLLGGDYVFLHAHGIERLAARLGRIPAPHGRFAVLGNHDLWADDRRITRALEREGIEVLVNRSVRLAPPFDAVTVLGLDEPWCGAPDASATFRDAGEVRLLLMHAPSGLLHVEERRFDVAFCGHTHGGQLALPGGRPIVVPGPLSRRFPHGRFDVGASRTLLVSRGVGGVEVPFRTFADPDVLVCTLHESE